MKKFIKYIFTVLIYLSFYTHIFAQETIKIGLLVPLSGENKKIGESIINTTRMALNSIDNKKIVIYPRDSKSDPDVALKISRDLNEKYGIKIIIGPVFSETALYLNQLPNITFLSFTNKLENNHKNVISTGVNALSQMIAIKRFLSLNDYNKTLYLIPNSKFKNEIQNAISSANIKIKKKFIYDTDPTLLTAQIEKITKYPQRKLNLIDEIKRVENSNDPNKEKKLENLNMKDTIGGIDFDSVVMADFDEGLKSLATSLLYTDVSSKRVAYVTLNQWFDKSLIDEKALQPIYFPSVNKENYEKFISDYEREFEEIPNHISFLSYDLTGLIYYLLLKNNFEIDTDIFYKKNRFKGKIGIFEINQNKITHELSFYSVENKEFKKIF
tara:strand:- start:97 stop:1248 length:1152 start_codon:yes stop_codon:yes gene_type:complete